MEEAIATVGTLFRAEAVPDLTVRVMAALPHHQESPSVAARVTTAITNALRWMWSPRPIALRPAFGVGFALAVALILLGRVTTGDDAVAAVTPGFTAAQPVYVQFRLDTTDASQVSLAGSFTEWQPNYSLHEAAPGVWTVTVPLDPGVHDYLFVVDGERWVPDPVAQPVADGFGGTNSRLLLTPPPLEV